MEVTLAGNPLEELEPLPAHVLDMRALTGNPLEALEPLSTPVLLILALAGKPLDLPLPAGLSGTFRGGNSF